jgi:hypothetical protein
VIAERQPLRQLGILVVVGGARGFRCDTHGSTASSGIGCGRIVGRSRASEVLTALPDIMTPKRGRRHVCHDAGG